MPCANLDLPLADLEGLYFAQSSTSPLVHRADSNVTLLMDGIDYLQAVNAAFEMTSTTGDVIYIVAWRLDPTVNLRPADQPAKPFGEILAEKASQGVDVRVILSAHFLPLRTATAWIPLDAIQAVEYLRGISIGGATPLADRVLLDSTAPALGGSHHQKAVVVKHGTEVVAFAAGIDPWPNRLDHEPHNTFRNNGTVWGWHDMGVKVEGGAVADLWQNFLERWTDAATASPKVYSVYDLGNVTPDGGPAIDWKLHNPSILNQGVPLPGQIQSVPSSSSVQILRSRYPRKEAGTSSERMWASMTSGGLLEIFHTYLRAISSARCYIYIEDQYFRDKSPGLAELPDDFSLFPALLEAAGRGVRLILVGGAISDPDPIQQPQNQTLEDAGQIFEKIIGPLPLRSERNVSVCRIEHTFVHAKVLIVDDCFAAIGSANFMSRSMYGVDSELQVGVVGSDPVRDIRMRIWGEHLRLGPQPWPGAVSAALANLDTALGIWRSDWLDPPSDIWRVSGNPSGFSPTEAAITFLGPS